VKASELKKGMIIREDGEFYIVVGIDHRTQGNKRGIYQTSLKALLDPRVINKRYSPTDTIEKADLESKKFQYLYKDHAGYHFMDMATYESIALSEDMVGSGKDYLKENLEVQVFYYEHHPITIELPVSVALKVTHSAPGIKGDTTGRTVKPATLETGLTINVPLFIEEGEEILIDTRYGDYLGRA
jgi:elongation factor P